MKYIYISIFFILNLFISNTVIADQSVIKELQKGGKIVFIRHSLAPGNGDPDNIDLTKCDTQRNLNQEGIEQSKNIGILFSDNNIQIDKVLSSEWCRCKDTARFAFNNYETFKGLNSFYQEKFYKYKDEQIKSLKKYISNWNSDKNLILVTHFVVISEMLNFGTSSGEIVVIDKDYKFIGSIETM
ncbi:histidine phosphatase family protein [Candidatus Pelagibacter sp.]|nr:histidine phosphatase family protein [Candidatus Pelagibacter sp.]